MKLRLIFLILSLTILFPAALVPKSFDLAKPDRIITLPPELREISGQVALNADTLACVDDNRGIICLFSLLSLKVTDRIVFSDEKDFEGLTWTGTDFFALKSDGSLFRVPDNGKRRQKGHKIKTGIRAEEFEGLFYDAASGNLLISTKSGTRGMPGYVDGTRFIYGFSIASGKLSGKPYRVFNPEEIRKYARKHGLDPSGQKIEFIPSEIAVDPLSRELFVLSGKESLLYVFSAAGKLKEVNRLNKAVYPQAEGLCFLPDGRLVISSEGIDSPGTLIILRRQVK
jgi:hypothetical protein